MGGILTAVPKRQYSVDVMVRYRMPASRLMPKVVWAKNS